VRRLVYPESRFIGTKGRRLAFRAVPLQWNKSRPAGVFSFEGILIFAEHSTATGGLLGWLAHRWARITLFIVFLLFLLLFVGV
jgi:hypothetical protein